MLDHAGFDTLSASAGRLPATTLDHAGFPTLPTLARLPATADHVGLAELSGLLTEAGDCAGDMFEMTIGE